MGRKSLNEICGKVGIDQNLALQRLALAGISARADDITRDLATQHEVSPIDLLKLMLTPTAN